MKLVCHVAALVALFLLPSRSFGFADDENSSPFERLAYAYDHGRVATAADFEFYDGSAPVANKRNRVCTNAALPDTTRAEIHSQTRVPYLMVGSYPGQTSSGSGPLFPPHHDPDTVAQVIIWAEKGLQWTQIQVMNYMRASEMSPIRATSDEFSDRVGIYTESFRVYNDTLINRSAIVDSKGDLTVSAYTSCWSEPKLAH